MLLFALLLLATVHAVAGIDPRCSFGSVTHVGEMLSHGDYCYHFVSMQKSWFAARQYCFQHGYHGNFVEIYHRSVYELLQQALRESRNWQSVDDVWIGASDSEKEGDYRWTTNHRVNILEWAPGEPDGIFHDCVKMTRDTGWRYVDWRCSAKHEFICMYRKLPEDAPAPGASTTPPPATPKCRFEGLDWEIGNVWSLDPCKIRCFCLTNGQVSCEQADCQLQQNTCTVPLEPQLDTCCGVCPPPVTTTITAPHHCRLSGQWYPVGPVLSTDPCLKQCACEQGEPEVACTHVRCPAHSDSCMYIPVRGQCCDSCVLRTPTPAFVPTTTPGEIVYPQQPTNPPATQPPHRCLYNGQLFGVGPVQARGACDRDCYCRESSAEVQCAKAQCYPLPALCIPVQTPGECCAQCQFPTTTATTTTTTTPERPCQYGFTIYQPGPFTVHGDPCKFGCYCHSDGFAQCNEQLCPPLPPPCIALAVPGQCCPHCQMPTTPPPQTKPPVVYCNHQGVNYRVGAVPDIDACTINCECVDTGGSGRVICASVKCSQLPPNCRAITDPGSCCPRCELIPTTTPAVTTTTPARRPHTCWHMGVSHHVGSVKSSNPCEFNCLCTPDQDYVTCNRYICPVLNCAFYREPGQCCALCRSEVDPGQQASGTTTDSDDDKGDGDTRVFLGLAFIDGIGLLIGIILLALLILILIIAILVRRRRRKKQERHTSESRVETNMYYNNGFGDRIATDVNTATVSYSVPGVSSRRSDVDDVAIQKYRNQLEAANRSSLTRSRASSGSESVGGVNPAATAGYPASEAGYADLEDVRSTVSSTTGATTGATSDVTYSQLRKKSDKSPGRRRSQQRSRQESGSLVKGEYKNSPYKFYDEDKH